MRGRKTKKNTVRKANVWKSQNVTKKIEESAKEKSKKYSLIFGQPVNAISTFD